MGMSTVVVGWIGKNLSANFLGRWNRNFGCVWKWGPPFVHDATQVESEACIGVEERNHQIGGNGSLLQGCEVCLSRDRFLDVILQQIASF